MDEGSSTFRLLEQEQEIPPPSIDKTSKWDPITNTYINNK